MRLLYFAIVLWLLCASASLAQANDVPASQRAWKSQSDVEIRQQIVGTWTCSFSYYTSTNPAESFSGFETLTYMTNGCYSATQTIDFAGTNRIEKCQGFWSVKDHFLNYSITNSVGVKPDLDPFFYPQAKVVRVNEKQLCLIERMDRICWFERHSTYSLDLFHFIDRTTTVEQLKARIALPYMDIMISPGHDILTYDLADDTSVAIETENDGSHIHQVQHDQTNLFEQPWLPVNSWMKR